jgi:hypothetical protein
MAEVVELAACIAAVAVFAGMAFVRTLIAWGEHR